MSELSLNSFLQLTAFPQRGQIKLYRHVDHRLHGKENPKAVAEISIEQLAVEGSLEDFQKIQGRHIFGEDYVLTFVAETVSTARLFGAYKVIAHGRGGARSHMINERSFYECFNDDDYWYQLQKIDYLSSFENRLVIKWPKARISHRVFRDQKGNVREFEISELKPHGFFKSFPGFDELVLTFSELESLSSSLYSSHTWVTALQSTRGVYLITDTENGELYVGSATGMNGIWGRWSNYAKIYMAGISL